MTASMAPADVKEMTTTASFTVTVEQLHWIRTEADRRKKAGQADKPGHYVSASSVVRDAIEKYMRSHDLSEGQAA